GYEYEYAYKLAEFKPKLILPLTFPDAIDVADPDAARNVRLQELKRWEQAPANAYWLASKGISFAFTTAGLTDKAKFRENWIQTIRYGLTEEQALAAVTTIPAQLLGAERWVGTLEKGKFANFLITSGNIFDKNTVIYEHWIRGKQYELEKIPKDIRGTYQLNWEFSSAKLKISGTATKPTAQILRKDTISVTISPTFDQYLLSFTDTSAFKGMIRMKASFDEDTLIGRGELPNGQLFYWTANRIQPFTDTTKTAKIEKVKLDELSPITYPNMAYGFTELPKPQKVLFKGATVWTNTERGIIKNTDVLIDKGKIVLVGENLTAIGAVIVDAQGKHLTTGIIDEHSHIAIEGGVNEGTESITAEVRIGDVLDNEDVNIYRQLAGGVTGAQLLHGSANCIGGQSAIIKHRWGRTPEE
ncbi:MAG: amidohydrolase family protein, partial [Bacteroidia bacterium]|nr:amidohydrolase family protein [Bacteroidia bacterium]